MNQQPTIKSGTAFKQSMVNQLPKYGAAKKPRRKRKRKGMGNYYD